MVYYSRAELVTQLTEIETKIEAAEEAESYAIGDRSLKRNLKLLYKRRENILAQIEASDRASDGYANKGKFARPV